MGARAAELLERETHILLFFLSHPASCHLLAVLSKKKGKKIICSMASREQLHWFQKEVWLHVSLWENEPTPHQMY